MKKYLAYILIPVALVVSFSQMGKVYAETGGDCTITIKALLGNSIPGYPSYTVRTSNEDSCTATALTEKNRLPGIGATAVGVWTSVPIVNSNATTPPTTNTTYQLLAPLPCQAGDSGCDTNNQFSSYDPTQNNNLAPYLNLMIRIFIGICAVLAVIMIVMGGIEYMTSELISSKEEGKKRITNAIFGLLLALGAWTLLNQINPDLLKADLSSLKDAVVTIQDFKVSGALSRNGQPISVNFNTEAYPAAKNAQEKTGVDEALVLAIFAQETGGGTNTGACHPNDPGANMTPENKAALQTIMGPKDINSVYVSCALSSGGHGGAIGLTQFLPTTWLQYKDRAAGLLGHQPDPWDTKDALMMTAVFLQANGGATNPNQAACAYFGSCVFGGVNYADQVVAKMNSIQTQIAQAKKDGKIS